VAIHNYLCCMGVVLSTWVKLLTDLQNLGCELHKKAFGGRPPPGTARGAITLPRPSNRYKGEGKGEWGRKGLGIDRGRKGREGECKGVGRDGRGRDRKGRKSNRGKERKMQDQKMQNL